MVPEFKSDQLLFLTEPKVTVYPFPIDVPKLAGKFTIHGIAIAHEDIYPYFYYLYPSGIWRNVAQIENLSAYFDSSAQAKELLLRTRIQRHPEWKKDADEGEVFLRYTNPRR